MKVLVAGAGAVGSYLGGKLALSGNEVTLFSRRRHYCEEVSLSGLEVTETGFTRKVRVKVASELSSLFKEGREYSLAIVAAKSHSTQELLETLSPYLSSIGHFVSVQNGLGNEEILFRNIDRSRITAASLTTACSLSDNEVVVENQGGIALSPVQTAVPLIVQLFRSAGLNVRVISDWQAMKWSKLLLNILGNATCALLDMSPSEVYSNRALFRIEKRAFLEAVRVMEAYGLKPVALPCRSVPLYVATIRFLPEVLLQPIFKHKMASGRGNKLASLHLDLQEKKSQTEAYALYGIIADRGKEKGVETPVLTGLYKLLQGVTQGAIPWEGLKQNPEAFANAIFGQRVRRH